jgi:limonene-1,2-epoxide hydrolase
MSDIVKMFRRVKDAEAKADVATMRELFTPDAALYEPYMCGTMTGPAIPEYMGSLVGEDIASLSYEILESVVDGNRAAFELTERVVTLDGKQVTLANCTLVERRGERFVRWHEYLQAHRLQP